MSLHHDLFLISMGLDRTPIQPPERVATIAHASVSFPPQWTIEDYITATERAKELVVFLPPTLRMKRSEYERLRRLLAPHLRDLKAEGLLYPSFNGVDLIVEEDQP